MSNPSPRLWLYALGLALATSSASDAQPVGRPLAETSWTSDWPESEIATLLEKVDANAARSERVHEQARALDDERRRAYAALRATARVLYRMTRAGILPFGGARFETLVQDAADAKRLRRAVAAGVAKLRAIEGRRQALQRRRDAIEAEIAQARARLQQLRQRLALTRDGVLASANEPFESLSVAGSGRRESENQAFYGLRVLDPDPEAGFARQRGNLAIPIRGEFVLRETRSEEGDGLGLEFGVNVGTPVMAAAAGRVAFCDQHGSYGRLVILDHGGNYYTVYGGLGAVEVRVGDDLSRAARIGTVGSHSSPPSLLFEVRRGTRTLPPRTWLGL